MCINSRQEPLKNRCDHRPFTIHVQIWTLHKFKDLLRRRMLSNRLNPTQLAQLIAAAERSSVQDWNRLLMSRLHFRDRQPENAAWEDTSTGPLMAFDGSWPLKSETSTMVPFSETRTFRTASSPARILAQQAWKTPKLTALYQTVCLFHIFYCTQMLFWL